MKGEHLGPDDPAERMRAEERHRLALYLHDHVGQILTLTKLQLARIQQALREPVDPAKQAWLQTTVDSLIPELDAVMQDAPRRGICSQPNWSHRSRSDCHVRTGMCWV